MLLLVFFLALSSCKGSPNSTGPISSGSNSSDPLCSATSAQLIVDMTTPIANYTWNDPHVIKEGLNYWMYASATDNFIFPVQLFRLGSTDGLIWDLEPISQSVASPMLVPGGATGTWDDGGMETPAVAFFNSKYHLFFTTYVFPPNDPAHSVLNFRIGHAVSADGITGWAVDENPVVSPGASGTFNEFIVAEPAPVVFNSKLYLYFTALVLSELSSHKMVARWSDGRFCAATGRERRAGYRLR